MDEYVLHLRTKVKAQESPGELIGTVKLHFKGDIHLARKIEQAIRRAIEEQRD